MTVLGQRGRRVEGDRSNVAPTVAGHTITSSAMTAVRPSPGQPRGGGRRPGGRSSYTPDPRRNVSEETADPRLTEGETAGGEHICRGERGSNSFPTLRDLISSRGFGKRNQAPERIMI